MLITVATANYYHLPFEQALAIIASAGFQQVELDLFWERKQWAMAQHLRGWTPPEIVRQICQAGLRVASIHDGGGVLDHPDSIAGFINPQLDRLLDCLGYMPATLVFHTPHFEGRLDAAWWRSCAPRVVAALEPYRGACRAITIENMAGFEGYTVPLLMPEELAEFAAQAGLGVTLDTTHYAQLGVDGLRAAQTLSEQVRTVHLSDFQAGMAHVFPGAGELDLAGILRSLNPAVLQSITLECAPGLPGEDRFGMDQGIAVERLKEARRRVEQAL
jgi:sugar phosphate isomerase/epimerase